MLKSVVEECDDAEFWSQISKLVHFHTFKLYSSPVFKETNLSKMFTYFHKVQRVNSPLAGLPVYQPDLKTHYHFDSLNFYQYFMHPFAFLKHIRDVVLPVKMLQLYTACGNISGSSTYRGEIPTVSRGWRNGGVVIISELETELYDKGPSQIT